MSKITGSSRRMFDFLTGRHMQQDVERLEPPASAGPTLVKIRDPYVDLDAVMELLEETSPDGRKANSWLKRKKRRLALDEDGKVCLEGRHCCFLLSQKIDRKLHRITLGDQFECEECGTIWAVHTQVREQRQHGVW